MALYLKRKKEGEGGRRRQDEGRDVEEFNMDTHLSVSQSTPSMSARVPRDPHAEDVISSANVEEWDLRELIRSGGSACTKGSMSLLQK